MLHACKTGICNITKKANSIRSPYIDNGIDDHMEYIEFRVESFNDYIVSFFFIN